MKANPSRTVVKLYRDTRELISSSLKRLYAILTADGKLWSQSLIFVDIILLYVAACPCLMAGCI